MGIIASCFRYDGPRRKIVLTELEFPTNMYLFEGFARYGAEIVYVPSDNSIRNDLDRLLDAIDERTVLVPLSLVLFRSSCIQDARAVIEKAHRVGAHVILDVYQAAGTVPLDVEALEADFAVGGSVKWLCGGPGAGYLYVRPDLARTLEPGFVGWAAHAEPFAFATGPVVYADGRRAVPERHAERPGALRRARRLRDRRGDRRAGDPREVAAADAPHHRPRHARRLSPSTRPSTTRERGGAVIIDVPNGEAVAEGSHPPRDHHRLPSGRRHPHLAAFLQHTKTTIDAGDERRWTTSSAVGAPAGE